ncbi:hypothetical protein, partial [Xanthomonas campestris]|uniref:hypothetical protein n=1 Tax=Xanthomonas campestris TaxID=339 RepID=UPI003CF2EB60
AMATDGFVVDVAANTTLTTPIHIIHVTTRSGASAFTRSLLRFGAGVRASLVESFVAAEGATAYQAYDSVVIWIGDGTQLE